jgi:hypothetical protein
LSDDVAPISERSPKPMGGLDVRGRRLPGDGRINVLSLSLCFKIESEVLMVPFNLP